MRTSSDLIEKCNKHFTNVFEISGDDNQVLISFFGHFSQDTINRLLEQLEAHLNRLNETKRTTKRIFSIVVEGLQNILLHGRLTLDDHRLGFFTFAKKTEGYNIYFGNLINEVDHSRMENEFIKINNFTALELKEYYKKILFEGTISSKGGAGLGLIITGMKTDTALNYSFSKLIDPFYFYSLHCFVQTVSTQDLSSC
jgi:hypothetical protein